MSGEAAAALGASLCEVLRDAVQDAIQEWVASRREPTEPAEGWLNVDSTAKYLDTTPEAIRSLVKRSEIPVHRTPNGRLLFDLKELDGWVRGSS